MPKTSQAEVARIATLWRLDEAMAGRASGIHTWVTEAGGNLAAGQRQRIAIARAMVGSPRILLLDDPSRSLDPIGREILLRAIRNYRGTVLLVTNEPAEAALADEVWHMDGGTIASTESGDEYRSRLERTAPLLAERRPTPVVSLRNPAGPESPGAGQLS
jgi:ABC-type bacteriocin/lantibiotic exporter with double-glycine peptidase domain